VRRQMAQVSLALLSGLILVSTILLFLAGSPDTVQADPGVLYVAPGSDCGGNSPCYATIQAAVDVASNGDTIKVAQGIYTGSGFQVVYVNSAITLTGGYTLTDWANSHPITQPTVIDAENTVRRRGVYIDGTGIPTITLAGLTIRHGYAQDSNGGGVYILTGTVVLRDSQVLGNVATGSPTSGAGGGVFVANGTVTLNDNNFQGNSADDGGAIAMWGGIAALSANTLQDNSADFYGGGIYVSYGIASVVSNTFHNNSGYYAGGGVYAHSGTVILSNNHILTNTTTRRGGGVYVFNGSSTPRSSPILNNTILGNTAGIAGGGIYASYTGGTVTVSHNVVQANSATQTGGGIHIEEGIVDLISNTIQGNWADNGGGVYLKDANGLSLATLIGNTIEGNSANDGGGVYVANGPVNMSGNTIRASVAAAVEGSAVSIAGGTVNAQNDIVAHSISAWTGVYLSGGFLTARHWTLADNGDYALINYGGQAILTNTIVVSHSLGGFWGPNITADTSLFFTNGAPCGSGAFCTHNLFGDPKFVNLEAGDYHIASGSAAADQGVDVGVVTDIDGDPRTDGHPDIGADELVGALIVTKQAYPARVQPGGQLTYTIRVTNTGFVTLTASITDTLPEHITLGETSAGTLILPGEAATWTALSIAPVEVWTDTVVVTLEVDYAGPLTNVVEVTTNEGASGHYVYTLAPDLEVTKQAHSDQVRAGERLTYTIYVTNTGSFDLHATITDTLPNHVTTTQQLVWTSQLIPAPNGIWTETIVVTVEMGYDGSLANVVEVTTEEEATGVYTETSIVTVAAPHPVGTDPSPNALNVPVTSTVSITFREPISANSVTTRTFAVFGNQSPMFTGTYSLHDLAHTVTLDPGRAFFPGERIDATVTTAALSITGQQASLPTVWQFWARVNGGSGDFGSPRKFGRVWPDPIQGDQLQDLAMGDMDGDGHLDVIVGTDNRHAAGGPSAVYFNDGDGTFDTISATIGPASGWILGLVVGDVDGDVDLDIVATTATAPWEQQYVVYFNNRDGTFDAISATIGSSIDRTGGIALGDVDGDADLDVVAGNYSGFDEGAQNAVYFNDGDGTFDTISVTISVDPDNTSSLAVGDVDGDGDLDLVTGNFKDSGEGVQNWVYFNDGDGTFDSDSYALGLGDDLTMRLALGDLDGDGDLDVVAGNGPGRQDTVHFNSGDGTFPDSYAFGDTRAPSDLVLGDVDGDGDLDLLVGYHGWQDALFLNDGYGVFDAGSRLVESHSNATVQLALGDVDGDGDLDLAVGNYDQQSWVYLNLDRVSLYLPLILRSTS
jgi:uncharacterized repeat protein (TIGR01451 family)